MRRQLSLVAVALALSFATPTTAQEQGERPSGGSTAYRVGPGDVLEIDVYDDPDLSGLSTIQHEGEISFPLLGDIAIKGMTVKEVQATLVELLAKDYLVDPQVMVRVKEYRSQWVTLIGEVIRPGKYYLQGAKSMLDLLTEAGGFTSRASGEVIVSRLDDLQPSVFMAEDNGDGNGGDSTVRIFLTPDQPPSEQKEALSFRLKSGDIVTVTSTQFFFISGEVKRPGSYPVTSGLTVLKAVSVAGGLTKFGAKGKVEILRKSNKRGPERIKVNLGDIENGKKPDVPLEPEDIIKVGKRVF